MWLPAAERTGEIHFRFARSLPYRRRLQVAFGLMFAGLAVQIALLGGGSWALGLPLSLVGVALLIVAGYRNSEETTGPAESWRSARRVEVGRILEISRKQRRWDQDAVDITNGTGFMALLGVVMVLALVTVIVPELEMVGNGTAPGGAPDWLPRLRYMLLADFAIMLLPFWFTGTRSVLKNNKLVNKAKLLLAIDEDFARLKRDGEVFDFQLQTVPTGEKSGHMPVDVKAAIRFPGGPPEFLGLQMQVAINSVEGSDYPYFYCVLVAKTGFGKLRVAPPPRGLVVEPSTETDVQVVVIRQQTTKKSGYHTDQEAARRILGFSLEQARGLVGAR